MTTPYVNIFDRSKDISYGEIIIAENIKNRGKYQKEYIMSNGIRKVEIYADAVHYDNNGQWEEIDNTLVKTTSNLNSAYVNTAGIWQVSLPDSFSSTEKVYVTKDKPFRYTTKTEFVFSAHGVFASPTFCIADEYAIERYKNHP